MPGLQVVVHVPAALQFSPPPQPATQVPLPLFASQQ
jgi:hypothetical protein